MNLSFNKNQVSSAIAGLIEIFEAVRKGVIYIIGSQKGVIWALKILHFRTK